MNVTRMSQVTLPTSVTNVSRGIITIEGTVAEFIQNENVASIINDHLKRSMDPTEVVKEAAQDMALDMRKASVGAAQAAAYCFSKYQRRSAGSFLAGVSLYHNDLRVVKEELPPEAAELREVWTAQKGLPRFLYNDFCLLFGYGHNWTLGRKWLINATLTPYLGYRHFIRTDINDPASAFSLNLRLRVGVVYNHKRFFVGLHNLVDMHRYRSEQYRLYNGLIDTSLLAGIRF